MCSLGNLVCLPSLGWGQYTGHITCPEYSAIKSLGGSQPTLTLVWNQHCRELGEACQRAWLKARKQMARYQDRKEKRSASGSTDTQCSSSSMALSPVSMTFITPITLASA